MSSDLFEQERLSDLRQATITYNDAKANYQRLVRAALQESDSTKRSNLVAQIQIENARLVETVKTLAAQWESEQSQVSEDTVDLEKEIASFQDDLDRVNQTKDNIIQLQNVLTSLSGYSDYTQSYYYGYIIGVLILLVIVFVLFVTSYFSAGPSVVEKVLTPGAV